MAYFDPNWLCILFALSLLDLSFGVNLTPVDEGYAFKYASA